MATSSPSTFRDTASIASRKAEANQIIPDLSWSNGMNNGLCAPGIGVALGQPNAAGTPNQFTLLDQDGDIRVPQVSQSIGGVGFADAANYPSSGGAKGAGTEFIIGVINPTQAAKDADSDLRGSITVDGTANLQTLAAGWVKTAV
jgi:hypothetical protein